MARRSAQPLSPGPSPSPSPRPGLSSLLGSFSSLPASPPPQTHKTRPPPPPQIPPTFPSPPFPPLRSTQKLQARRLLRTAPIFLLASSSLTGEGRPEAGEARSRGGRRSGRSARSCFPAFQREKKERGTSGIRARRRRRPLYRAAPAGLRATPASASIPTPPPPAPRFPRAAPHSASSSHAAAQGYESLRRRPGPGRGLPARGRAPSLGAASRAVRTGSTGGARPACAWRLRELCGASRGELEGIGRSAPHSNGILSRPAASPLPVEGVKRRPTTLEPVWSGLLSAARPGRRLLRSLCGGRRRSQVELRVHAACHPGRVRGTAGPGPPNGRSALG